MGYIDDGMTGPEHKTTEHEYQCSLCPTTTGHTTALLPETWLHKHESTTCSNGQRHGDQWRPSPVGIYPGNGCENSFGPMRCLGPKHLHFPTCYWIFLPKKYHCESSFCGTPIASHTCSFYSNCSDLPIEWVLLDASWKWTCRSTSSTTYRRPDCQFRTRTSSRSVVLGDFLSLLKAQRCLIYHL
jgi:hypothetical protein